MILIYEFAMNKIKEKKPHMQSVIIIGFFLNHKLESFRNKMGIVNLPVVEIVIWVYVEMCDYMQGL